MHAGGMNENEDRVIQKEEKKKKHLACLHAYGVAS